MSKQSDAKKAQGYDERINLKTCGNCYYFTSDKYERIFYPEEKNLRCGIGEFAVKKSRTCDRWKLRKT